MNDIVKFFKEKQIEQILKTIIKLKKNKAIIIQII